MFGMFERCSRQMAAIQTGFSCISASCRFMLHWENNINVEMLKNIATYYLNLSTQMEMMTTRAGHLDICGYIGKEFQTNTLFLGIA